MDDLQQANMTTTVCRQTVLGSKITLELSILLSLKLFLWPHLGSQYGSKWQQQKQHNKTVCSYFKRPLPYRYTPFFVVCHTLYSAHICDSQNVLPAHLMFWNSTVDISKYQQWAGRQFWVLGRLWQNCFEYTPPFHTVGIFTTHTCTTTLQSNQYYIWFQKS